MADILTFGDQLRIEGINFKGFGIIPKYVMIDPDLTIGAKSLYAYFCSFAGSGNSTFPSRSKILADLKIGKRAYYNDLNLLTEQGYIKVEQKKHSNNQFKNNIYTLISNPKKFGVLPDDSSKSKVYSKISVSGLKSAGYGMIPKAAMTDERLALKSKGIYAYFCSFTGAGDSACPKLETILYHLRVSKDTYYKYFNTLTKLNYISVVQRHENGLLGVNDYYINDNPDESASSIKEISLYSQANHQLPKNEDTGNKDTENQFPKNEDTENEDTENQFPKNENTENQYTENQDTTINNLNKNNSTITSLYNEQSFNHPDEGERVALTDKAQGTEIINRLFGRKISPAVRDVLTLQKIPYDYSKDRDKMSEVIHYITYWDSSFPNGYPDELEQKVYNLFNGALIEMCCSTRTMNLRGALVTSKNVIDKLNQLLVFSNTDMQISEILDFAMSCYLEATTEIRHPLPYMKACIWEAMNTGDIGLYEECRPGRE